MKKQLVLLTFFFCLVIAQPLIAIQFRNNSNETVYVNFFPVIDSEKTNEERPSIRYLGQKGESIGINLFLDAAQICNLIPVNAKTIINIPDQFKPGNKRFSILVSTLDSTTLANALQGLPTTQRNTQQVAQITDGSVKAYIFPQVKRDQWQKGKAKKVRLTFPSREKKLAISASTRASKPIRLTQGNVVFYNIGAACVPRAPQQQAQMVVEQEERIVEPAAFRDMPQPQQIQAIVTMEHAPEHQAQVLQIIPPNEQRAVLEQLPDNILQAVQAQLHRPHEIPDQILVHGEALAARRLSLAESLGQILLERVSHRERPQTARRPVAAQRPLPPDPPVRPVAARRPLPADPPVRPVAARRPLPADPPVRPVAARRPLPADPVRPVAARRPLPPAPGIPIAISRAEIPEGRASDPVLDEFELLERNNLDKQITLQQYIASENIQNIETQATPEYTWKQIYFLTLDMPAIPYSRDVIKRELYENYLDYYEQFNPQEIVDNPELQQIAQNARRVATIAIKKLFQHYRWRFAIENGKLVIR